MMGPHPRPPNGESRRYKPSRAAAAWSLFAAVIGFHAAYSWFGSTAALENVLIAVAMLFVVVYGFVFRYASWLNAAKELNDLYRGAR